MFLLSVFLQQHPCLHHVHTKLLLDHSINVEILSNEMHAHHVYTKLILDHSSVDILSNEMHAHHVYTKLLPGYSCVNIFSNECMHTMCTLNYF